MFSLTSASAHMVLVTRSGAASSVLLWHSLVQYLSLTSSQQDPADIAWQKHARLCLHLHVFGVFVSFAFSLIFCLSVAFIWDDFPIFNLLSSTLKCHYSFHIFFFFFPWASKWTLQKTLCMFWWLSLWWGCFEIEIVLRNTHVQLFFHSF